LYPLLTIVVLSFLVTVRSLGTVTAQENAPILAAPCPDRVTGLSQPWVGIEIPCLEQVVNDPSLGELAFTSLAVSPENVLYATRPLAGEVWALEDTNDDSLPDTPRMIADGLTLPNGLAYYDNALYISGGAHIYRLRDDVLETLVDNLPAGDGFWTGGIAVGEDQRIYVVTGAPCDFCAFDDAERGAILSFTVDGGDRQVIATGLRQPADIAFHQGALYVVDSARDGLYYSPDLDEINLVRQDAFFGFPYCVGIGNTPDMTGFDCAEAVPPIAALPTASTPLGITSYESDLIPTFTGKLLVALGGSYNQTELRGYALAVVTPEDGTWRIFMPADSNGAFTVEQMSYRGSGTWPHRPFDIVVNEWGWVYFSVGGGRILAFRPET
jgi:glucose/arabinose dehydrogenase